MNIQVERYIRVESGDNNSVRVVIEISYPEYTRFICENWAEIINSQERELERQRQEEIERQNKADRERERQWYREGEGAES